MTWKIRDRATFVALGAAPRRRHGALSVSFVEGDPEAAVPPRVAYAIGKRCGGAVARNRLRRRLRVAVRCHSGALQPGGAYLIGASPAAASASYDDLESSLARLLQQLDRP